LKLLVEFLDLLRCTICVYGVLPLAQNVTNLGQCVSVRVLSCIIYMNQWMCFLPLLGCGATHCNTLRYKQTHDAYTAHDWHIYIYCTHKRPTINNCNNRDVIMFDSHAKQLTVMVCPKYSLPLYI
jgi:hypothetical protein